VRRLLVGLVVATFVVAACEADAPSPSLAPQPPATILPDRHSDDASLIATLPNEDHSLDFANSDMAFWGDLLVQGSYDGFRVVDISDPNRPVTLAEVACRGPQGDVSIWEHLVFVSVDRPQSSSGCESEDAEDADPLFLPDQGGWEGIRIFDVMAPSAPRLVGTVTTDCGSHTHTLVPDVANGRVLLYVSSYALLQDQRLAPDCINPHGQISVVEVPLDDPGSAEVITRPHLFDTPAWEVAPGAPPDWHSTAGCHDITVFMPLRLAAAACLSEGQIWDLSNPERPMAIAHVDLPEVAFWHSAAWSNDGSVIAFGDEDLSETGCTNDPGGALWFYRVSDPREPQLAGRFSLDRYAGPEVCSAHMFNVVPGVERDLLVGGFYAGGTSVVDFTDPSAAREVAYYDVGGELPGDVWSSYWYRGHVWVSDHHRGLDVLAVELAELDGATALDRLNPQTQE
jgi:hypothetical protein